MEEETLTSLKNELKNRQINKIKNLKKNDELFKQVANLIELKVLDEKVKSAMTPKPNEDLFIEPAGDFDVLYGDYNSTMEGSGGQTPYLRILSPLPNVTRSENGEVRLKCEAAGAPLPIKFEWQKNFAPLERNKRIRIKNKDYWSKLVITELDVLDSGYYQCTVKNDAGSRNSTSILKVNPSNSNSNNHNNRQKPSVTRHNNIKKPQNLDDEEDYDYFNEMKRLNDDDDDFAVPDNAGGEGYVPATGQRQLLGGGSSDRWLENKKIRMGECVLYQGEACGQYLGGRYIKLTSEDKEAIYEIDRNIKAAMMFINNMQNVADKCKRYSHAVACYHMYKICDRPLPLQYGERSYNGDVLSNNDVISICRKDCEDLKDRECPAELALAAQHELVGDNPKALYPHCTSLSPNALKCLPVFEPRITPPIQVNIPETASTTHWCYVGKGENYEGTASTTRSGRQCVSWPQSTSFPLNTEVFPKLKFSKNHCRNPEGRRQEPVCYTFSDSYPGKLVEEECGAPKCPPNFYPEFRPNTTRSNENPPPPLMDSLANVWRSLSSQWQMAFVSGISGIALILLILLICCVCCCRNKSKKQRRKASNSVLGVNGGGGTNSATTTIIHNLESGSSVISNGKKGNLGIPPNSINGGGSSMSNSDINNAYYRKNDINRMGDEALNPLLGYGQQHPQFQQPNSQQQHLQQQFQQQQMFEMQQQQQNFGVWDGYSGIGSLQQYPQQQFAQQQQLLPGQQNHMGYVQQIQQNLPYNNNKSSPHTSAIPAEPYQIQTIQEEQLKFDKKIGEDSSAVIYLGEWVGGLISGAALQVAIKTLKPGATQIAIENFREEIKEVGPFEHINVLRTFGVAYLEQQNISVVFDYSIHGDLHEFLKVREPRNGPENDEKERMRNAEDFLRICTQIASGMDYLASNSYVHRDLSARNCLVGDQQIIKIADFGRMKSCYDQDYYKINASVRVPLRWLSKEALTEARYSHASDVYAFGVTLWEMYTYGKQPYTGFSNQQVIEMINKEDVLIMPQGCPTMIYKLMIECWHQNPKKRPTFIELHDRFQKWVSNGQAQALFSTNQQQRASSVHSAASSGANGSGSGTQRGQLNSRQIGGSSGSSSQQLIRGLDQFSGVPSPAPNSTTNLCGGGNPPVVTGGGQITKLSMLNNGTSIVHSTPKGNRSPPRMLAPIIAGENQQNREPLMAQHNKNNRNFRNYCEDDDEDYSDEESS